MSFSASSLPGTFFSAALLVFGSVGAACAQADGAVLAGPDPAVAPAPNGSRFTAAGPGAALMNDLQRRMKEIQATPEPALRQRRMDEFLKTLQQGMAGLSQPPGAARR